MRLMEMVDRFVPIQMADQGADVLRRSRLLVAICLVGLPLLGTYALATFALGSLHGGLVTSATGLAVATIPWILRRTRSLGLTGNLLVALLFVLEVYLAGRAGGLNTPPLYWLAAAPLLALLLAGPTSGLAWTGIVALQVGGIFWLDRAGFFSGPDLDSGGAKLMGMLSLIGLALFLVAVGFVYESLKQRALDELERGHREMALARQQAEKATRAKSQFLANMSHEIRTPLYGIVGSLHVLQDMDLSDEQRRYIEMAQNSGQILQNLIDALLDLSRIEADRLELEVAPFNLEEMLEEVVAMLAEVASRKQLEVCCCLGPDVPSALVGDVNRLRQVLWNLLGNALKFTERGDVVLRVSVADREGEEVVLRVDVQDSGIGIPPEVQARIFEAFTQADASTTRRFGGSGLGLAIARHLVALHGGELHVESRASEGSRFWFTARMKPGQSAPPASDVALSDVPVLIVTGHPALREVLEGHLRRWGMCPACCNDPSSALESLRAAHATGHPFAAALLADTPSSAPPGLPDLVLARRIHQDPALASTPLVVLAPYGPRDTKGLQAADSRTVLLTRPVLGSNLRRSLVQALDVEVAPTTAPPPQHRERKAGRILIAEDSTVNQMITRTLLDMLGWESDVVASGREAVEAAEQRPYGLVLMDCHMPDMDGFQATAEIRRRENGGRRVPIVAVTACALGEERERCLAAGMDGHLAKPVDPTELETVVTKWMEDAPGS